MVLATVSRRSDFNSWQYTNAVFLCASLLFFSVIEWVLEKWGWVFPISINANDKATKQAKMLVIVWRIFNYFLILFSILKTTNWSCYLKHKKCENINHAKWIIESCTAWYYLRAGVLWYYKWLERELPGLIVVQATGATSFILAWRVRGKIKIQQMARPFYPKT